PRAAPAAGHAGGRAARALPVALAVAFALLVVPAAAAGATSGTSPPAVLDAGRPGAPVLLATPFAALLLAVAVLPVVPVAHHWWERNGFKLAVGLALGGVVLAHYAGRGYGYHGAAPGGPTVLAVLEHALLRDYVPFIVLLASLYVIAGGLQLKG